MWVRYYRWPGTAFKPGAPGTTGTALKPGIPGKPAKQPYLEASLEVTCTETVGPRIVSFFSSFY